MNKNERTWKAKWKEVNRIETLAYKRRIRPTQGPRHEKALYWAWTVGLMVLCTLLIVPLRLLFGLQHAVGSSTWAAAVFYSSSIGIGIFAAIHAFSKTPKTYSDAVDDCLAKYSPVDKEAYRKLQDFAREKGYVDSHELGIWASAEHRAIATAAGWAHAKADFFKKTV